MLETRLPDNTIVSAAYNNTTDTPANFNRTFATMTDQAGKKRRQLADALGRIVRVDEPVASPPDGNPLGPVETPHQPTYYEFDGNDNLTKVVQTLPWVVTQERVFRYDSLSRLTHERQVEATPTLDESGVKGTADPNKWTGYYKYTADGLLDYGVDARGVKTDFSYDGLNRVSSVVYTGETGYQTPMVTYTYSETETGFFNNGRLTKVETAAVSGQGTPATIQNYRYDSVGQVKKHTQTIDAETYQLEYGYNLAGQLVTEKYPSGKIVSMTVDNFGVMQTIADAQRTYLNGVTVNDKGQLSGMSLGNGTTETFTTNDRFQMIGQELKRGSEVLTKYDYSYGVTDVATGVVDASKNNGQLGKIESYIGASKQASQRFGYDELGRLSESLEHRGDNDSLTYKQKFDFDRFGNLYRKAASNPTTGQANPLPFTPIEDADIDKAKNRFATGTTYDEAGQVIQDNKFRSMGFSYDANGRVVKATKANTPDAHTVYDALGNRVATKVNDVWQYMVYDAFGKLVAEYGVANGGGGCSPASGSNVCVQYVQQDHQSSVRTVTNNSGFVLSRTDHQAFGEIIPSGVGLRTSSQGYGTPSSTRQGYGLTENDQASGQQHTSFRKLEPSAGRFSSPDPYNGSMFIGDPQSFNRYTYVGNDPTNSVDPSGLLGTICHAGEAYGGYFCSGGWSSGGGFYYYNPNAGGGSGYYGADAGYGSIIVTNTIILEPGGLEPRIFSNTHVSTFGFSPFGGFSGRGGGDAVNNLGDPCPPGPTRCAVQKAFDECATRAYREFRKQYVKDGFIAAGTGALIGLSIGTGYYLWIRGAQLYVGASAMHALDGQASLAKLIGMGLLPAGIGFGAVVQYLLDSGKASDEKLAKALEDCKSSYPSANHSWSFANF